MDISVIVPIYNVERYIERCLRSLFEQTKTKDVEFILVNDCTPDNSVAIVNALIEEYKDLNVKIINNDKNLGLALTRQNGLDAALGRYVIQIDSDDWCERDMLEQLYLTATRDNADIVVCDYYFNSDTRAFSYSKDLNCADLTDSVQYVGNILKNKIACFLWLRMVKNSLYKDYGIKQIANLNYGEDVYISSCLHLVAKRVEYLEVPFYHYCYNDNSMMNNLDFDKYLSNHISVLANLLEFSKRVNKYSELEPHILERKIRMKDLYLRSTIGENQVKVSKIFPEVTKYIFSSNSLSFAKKITLYLASNHMLFVSNFIYSLIRVINKIRKR